MCVCAGFFLIPYIVGKSSALNSFYFEFVDATLIHIVGYQKYEYKHIQSTLMFVKYKYNGD